MTTHDKPTKKEVLARIANGWDAFQAYLNTLTETQQTGPTDAAGWTVKDHVMHLALWEDGVYALLDGQSRPVYMGIDEVMWNSGDYDAINALLQQRYQDKTWADVRTFFQAIHERFIEKIQTLTDEDLLLPYSHYQPGSTDNSPVINRIIGNTIPHYAEHKAYIETLVGQ